jgi:O-antigen/teichoic acid export membrane protein
MSAGRMLDWIRMATDLQHNPLSMKSGIHVGWIRTIFYGAGLNTVGQISSLLLAAVLQLIIARSLGASMSGSIAFGVSLIGFLASLSLLGLDKGVVRFFPAYKSEPGKQINLIVISGLIALTISILLAVGLRLRADLFIKLFPRQELLFAALPYLLLLIPVNAMILYLGAVTQALRKFDFQAFFIQFLLPALKIAALVLIIYRVGKDLSAIVLGFVIVTALVILLLGAALWKYSRPGQLSLSVKVALGSLLVFSLPLFFITIVDYGWTEAQILILGSLVSSDQVGIYNVALRLTLMLTIFQTAFGTVFAPVIAELHQASNMVELSRLLKVVTRWSAMITIPIFLVMFCYPEDLLRIFGEEFVAGKLVLQILALGILLNVAVGPVGWFIVLTGRSFLSLVNSCVALLVNIVVTIFLTTKYGIVGAAVAIMLGLLVVNLMRLIEIKYIFGIHPFGRALMKCLVAGCLVLPVGLGLNQVAWPPFFSLSIWGTLIKLASYAALLTLLYAAILYLFRFDESDKQILDSIRGRVFKFLRAVKQPV